MLFREETGKHPFVILLNATFKTLKAVIDFVYRGETQILGGNLKEFLTLAQALQIKGLNAFPQDNNNKNQSSNTTENVQDSSENNQVTSEVQGIDASLENDVQQHSQLTDSYSDTAHTNSYVPIQAFSASCEKVQSTTLVTPLPEHHWPLEYDEVSINSERTVKHEPLCHVFSEDRNEILDSVQSHEPKSGKFRREKDVISASLCNEEDLNTFSSFSKFTLGNVDSSLMPPAQQRRIHLNKEVSFGGDVAERVDSSQPASLLPETEHMDDEKIEELLDDSEMSLDNTHQTDEEMEPAYRKQIPDQSTSADGLPLEEDLATQRRSLPGQQSTSSPPHTELQLHEGRDAHPGQQTVLSDEGGMALAHLPSPSTQKPRRAGKGPFRCDVCGKAFPFLSHLAMHKRAHTGERPYRCDVCSKGFTQSSNLNTHMRSHTEDRPYRCDECGEDFRHKCSLSYHKLKHVQQRP